MPNVTIGMPVYNSNPAYFRLALEALLAQEMGDFDLILSDNGSSEEARALYEEAARRDRRIRYVRHDANRGSVFNFNFVLSQARGDYFLWAADDDVHHPRFLAETCHLLDTRPRAASASSAVAFIDKQGTKIGSAEFSSATRRGLPAARVGALLAKHVYLDFYALHRRAALTRTRPMKPMFGGDYVLVLELLMQGTIERAPEERFSYRMHYGAAGPPPEHVWKQLVGANTAAQPVKRRGLLRKLVTELASGVLHAGLSGLDTSLTLSTVAAAVAVRRRNW